MFEDNHILSVGTTVDQKIFSGLFCWIDLTSRVVIIGEKQNNLFNGQVIIVRPLLSTYFGTYKNDVWVGDGLIVEIDGIKRFVKTNKHPFND